MTTNTLLALAMSALPMWGAVTNLQLVDVSRQQIVISFDVLNPASCLATAYTDSALTIKAEDTDISIFAASSNCNRAGNVVSGNRVTAIVGKRTAEVALDGKMHSRSLSVVTPYYIKVDDLVSSTSATVQATTTNIPWGDTHPDQIGFSASGFGNWAYPDLDWADAGVAKWYVDPLSGLTFRRMPRDELGGGGQFDNAVFGAYPFGGVFDITKEQTAVAKWGSLANALNTSTAGPFATYSGATQDPLFFAVDRMSRMVPYNDLYSFDDLQIHIFGSAPGCTGTDCNVLVCLVSKFNPVTNACTGPEIAVTLPVSAGQRDFPVSYPTYPFSGWNVGRVLRTEETGIWGSKGSYDYGGGGGGNPANATVTSSALTVGIGHDADTLLPQWAAPGMKVAVNGAWYTISTIADAANWTLQESAVTTSGTWMLANFGVRVRKQTANTNGINVSASFSFATTHTPQIASYAEHDWCSNLDFPLSVAADGTTTIPTKRARLCQVGEQGGVTQVLLVADDGEIRYLSRALTAHTSTGGSAKFSTIDPFTIYSSGSDDTNPVYAALYRVTYTPGGGCNYRTWTGNRYGVDTMPSDCMVESNITPASSSMSVTQQIAPKLSTDPIWDPGWDGASCGSGGVGSPAALCFANLLIAGHYAQYSTVGITGAQNGVVWFAIFDLNTGLFVKIFDSFSGSLQGMRWGGAHSGGETDGLHWIEQVFVPLDGNGQYFKGPWILPPGAISQKSIDGSTYTNDTSLPNNAPYGWTCGTNPYGVVGANCVWLHFTTNEACNSNTDTGISTEATRWPCSWRAGWSSSPLRLAPGDFISRWDIVANPGSGIDGKDEKMKVLTMTADGSGGWFAMIQRDAACPGRQYFGETNKATGWRAFVSATGACDGTDVWYDMAAPTTVAALSKVTAGQHGGFGKGPDNIQFTAAGSGSFTTGTFATAAGQAGTTFVQEASNVGWNGVLNGISDNVMETYSAVANYQAGTQLGRSLYYDARHMNPSSGSYPEKNGITLWGQTYTPVAGTSYVYKTSIGAGVAADHKVWRPVTMATTGNWQDISSSATGNQITDATPWASCYAYKANECRNGAAIGEYFVWSKNLWTSRAGCTISTLRTSSPCTYVPWPQAGWIIQSNTQLNDFPGTHIRRLTMGLVGPFSAYQFSGPHPTPDHKFMFVRYSYPNGVSEYPLLYKLPPPAAEDNIDRSRFVPVPIKVAAGGFRRIKFGYAENGPPSSFFCTSRQEACQTDAVLTPFAFAVSDVVNATNCGGAGPCTLTIPGLSGRVLYFEVDRSPDGSTGWVAGPLQATIVK